MPPRAPGPIARRRGTGAPGRTEWRRVSSLEQRRTAYRGEQIAERVREECRCAS